MNISDIIKKIQKSHLSAVKVNKEEMLEVLNHYKKLQIVYLDQDENVVFLWASKQQAKPIIKAI